MREPKLDRRAFVRAVGSGAVAALAPRGQDEESELRVAVIGLHGVGSEHVVAWEARAGVRVVALCDVDEEVLDAVRARARERGERVLATDDLGFLLAREDVDAVSLATPDHWHAIQAIEACRAGKHVFVESPAAHTLLEGTRIVEAARASGRVVHANLPARSSPGLRAAVTWLWSGELGAVRLARAIVYVPEPSIGELEGTGVVPESVDYDLWTGPAPLVPLAREHLHHDWRANPDTGGGALAAEGVPVLDLCRWALAEQELPRAALSLGGRFGYDDDGETPNTQMILFETASAPILCELRGLPRDAAEREGGWEMDEYRGLRAGALLECERGSLTLELGGRAVARDPDGAVLAEWEGAGDPFGSFAAAVRARAGTGRAAGSITGLGAEIEEARLSAGLAQLARASQTLAVPASERQLGERLAAWPAASEALERLVAHLAANHVDLALTPLELGPRLTLASGGTQFREAVAHGLETRTYRAPYSLPEGS